MVRAKVLSINAPSVLDETALASLNELVELTVVDQAPHDELAPVLAQAVKDHGPFTACIFLLKWHEPLPFPLDEALLGSLVDSGTKLFSCGGAGFDRVDISYLTRKQVYYANNPSTVAIRTADSTVMMILQALRASSYHEDRLRQGLWHDHTVMAKDARKSTLGVVGMGKIGKMVADHMRLFGMKVIYTKRSRLAPSDEDGAEYVSFEELLSRSDVVSLHCPLTAETRHLLGPKEFESMKAGVIIVNTSRGPVVDEGALVDAMASGKVLRCALDVFEEEPKVHPGLLSNTKATLSPHSAVLNETVMADAEQELLENLFAFVRSGVPVTPVNLV